MAQSYHQIDPVLTEIAVATSNPAYIGNEVIPTIPVSGKAFRYRRVDTDTALKPVKNGAEIGNTGRPESITTDSTLHDGVCRIYALSGEIDPVDAADNQRTGGMDVAAHVAASVAGAMDTQDEVRFAAFMNDTTNYSGSSALSGNALWDNDASNPMKAVLEIRRNMEADVNTMVMDLKTYNALRTHAKLVDATYKGGSVNGILNTEQLASLFDMDAIYVGRAFNIAAPDSYGASGSTLAEGTRGRPYGNFCALIRRAPTGTAANPGDTWAAKFQWRGREVSRYNDPAASMFSTGVESIKVGESNVRLLLNQKAGYLYTTTTS